MDKLGVRLNRMWVGIVAGMIGPVVGFYIFYLVTYSSRPFDAFVQMIINTSDTHPGIISVSLLFNLILFLGCMQLNWYYAARGLIASVFFYAPLVIYFKYFG